MSEKMNGKRKPPSCKGLEIQAKIQTQRKLNAYLRASYWDEAMNRRREKWLYERPQKSKHYHN